MINEILQWIIIIVCIVSVTRFNMPYDDQNH